MKNLGTKFLNILLCLLFLCAFCSKASAQKIDNPADYKMMSTQQWQMLSNNTNLLEANLILLQTELLTLSNQSKELKNLVTELMVELSVTKTALQSAQVSLSNVETSLMKIEKSYLELKTRIESERKEAIKKERDAYRKGWLNGFCCGLATGAIIVIK